MEKPPLEKLIKRLEELDIHEWQYEDSGYGKRLKTKSSGLTFYLYRVKDITSVYYLDIMNECQSKKVSYKSNKKSEGGVKKFYETVSDKRNKIEEEDFNEKVNRWLSEQLTGKPPLEKITEKLEKLDTREWNYIESGYGPSFTTRVNGLLVYLFVDRIQLGVKAFKLTIGNEEGNQAHIYECHKRSSPELHAVKKLYEKICREHDNLKETEFGENLQQFLSD